jgi:hypothetical protein
MYNYDFVIYYRFQSPSAIEQQLHLADSLWSQENGFKLPMAKTTCIHFCRLGCVFPHPNLFKDKSPVPFAGAVNLGLILDSRLTYEPHLWQLWMNILLILTGASWGAGRITEFTFYFYLTRSQLDHGPFIYVSASNRILSILDSIYDPTIRLCTGAFRMSSMKRVYRIRGTCTCHLPTDLTM